MRSAGQLLVLFAFGCLSRAFATGLEDIESIKVRIAGYSQEKKQEEIEEFFDRLIDFRPPEVDSLEEAKRIYDELRNLESQLTEPVKLKRRARILDESVPSRKRFVQILLAGETLTDREQDALQRLILSKNFQLSFSDEDYWGYIPYFAPRLRQEFIASLPARLARRDEFEVRGALELLRFLPQNRKNELHLTIEDIGPALKRENPTISYHSYNLLTQFAYDKNLAEKIMREIKADTPIDLYLGGGFQNYGTSEAGEVSFDVMQKQLMNKAKLQYLARFPEGRNLVIEELSKSVNSDSIKHILFTGTIEGLIFTGEGAKAGEFIRGARTQISQNRKLTPIEKMMFMFPGDIPEEDIEKSIEEVKLLLSHKEYRVREMALSKLAELYSVRQKEIDPKSLGQLLAAFNEYATNTENQNLQQPEIWSYFEQNFSGSDGVFVKQLKDYLHSPDRSAAQTSAAYLSLLLNEKVTSAEKHKLISEILNSKDLEVHCAMAGALSGSRDFRPTVVELERFFKIPTLNKKCSELVMNALAWGDAFNWPDQERPQLLKLIDHLYANSPNSKIRQLAQTFMVKLREAGARNFKEFVTPRLNQKMMNENPCDWICRIAEDDKWFAPKPELENFPERRVYASTSAYTSVLWILKLKASQMCPKLKDWPQSIVAQFGSIQSNSDQAVLKHWEEISRQPDLASLIYYNSYDMYTVSFGAQFLAELLDNQKVNLNPDMKSRLEKIRTGLARQRDSLLELPSYNTFLGRELTGDSRLQTYAFSLGLNSLSDVDFAHPNERQSHAIKLATNISDRLNNKLGVPYNPGIEAPEVSSRAASARDVPYYLALFRSSQGSQKWTKLLFESIKNYHQHHYDLIAHMLKDGFHDGSDGLGSHYYYPTFAYVGTAIEKLEQSSHISKEEKEQLAQMKSELIQSHLGLINKDGLFTPMGSSPQDTISHQNSNSYTQSLGVLGLMPFANSCPDMKGISILPLSH